MPTPADPHAPDADPVPEAHTHTELADGVLTVTIDRQAKRNAISEAATAALWDAVGRLRDDDDVGALVIRAVGDYFTAGIDLDSPCGRGQDVEPDEPNAGNHFRARYRNHHLLYDEIEQTEKPVILAPHAGCLGAGVEMGVSCDFRLCAESAWFRLPEVDLGTMAGSGGVSRLTRLVGPGWARWMAMVGEPVDSATALRIGLVQRVLPDDGFHDAVQRWAARVAALPREAVGLTKFAIDAADAADRHTARQFERLANTSLVLGPEFQSRKRRAVDGVPDRRAPPLR